MAIVEQQKNTRKPFFLWLKERWYRSAIMFIYTDSPFVKFSDSLIEKVTQYGDSYTQRNLLKHENAPEQFLLDIMDGKYPKVHNYTRLSAMNFKSPRSVIKKGILDKNNHSYARYIAFHRKDIREIFSELRNENIKKYTKMLSELHLSLEIAGIEPLSFLEIEDIPLVFKKKKGEKPTFNGEYYYDSPLSYRFNIISECFVNSEKTVKDLSTELLAAFASSEVLHSALKFTCIRELVTREDGEMYGLPLDWALKAYDLNAPIDELEKNYSDWTSSDKYMSKKDLEESIKLHKLEERKQKKLKQVKASIL